MSADQEHGPDLHVALLGYGKGGEVFHAPLIDATPGLKLSAVVTGNPERAAAVRERYPETQVIGSADELWQRAGEFELAVVTTPNDTHAPLARAALKAGLAVVVDKPFAVTAADAADLAEEAERLGQVLTVFQNRRWDSDFLTLWKLIDEGALGGVHRFESRFERWRPQAKDTWRERGTADEGAGILYDLGPHLIDQAVILFGPVAAVYAEVDALRGGADDDAFLALHHANGVRSHLWMSALAAQLGPRFRVLGDKAAFTINGLDGQEARLGAGERPGAEAGDWGVESDPLRGRLGTDDESYAVPSERGDYPAFYAEVREAVAEGDHVPVHLHEVVHGLQVIEAARRSAANGELVHLDNDA